VFAALIVRRRTEAARRGRFEFDALQEAVKGQIEIEAGLFAVGDDIQAGVGLITNRNAHGVVDHFGAIGFAKLIEMLDGKFQPAGKWIAPDDCCAQWTRSHAAA
jgi:hypothetical protein